MGTLTRSEAREAVNQLITRSGSFSHEVGGDLRGEPYEGLLIAAAEEMASEGLLRSRDEEVDLPGYNRFGTILTARTAIFRHYTWAG